MPCKPFIFGCCHGSTWHWWLFCLFLNSFCENLTTHQGLYVKISFVNFGYTFIDLGFANHFKLKENSFNIHVAALSSVLNVKWETSSFFGCVAVHVARPCFRPWIIYLLYILKYSVENSLFCFVFFYPIVSRKNDLVISLLARFQYDQRTSPAI